MHNYEFDQIKILATNECNLHCTHCFRSEKEQSLLISYEKLVEIVDFAIEHKTRKLSLSGGEYFTHPDAYRLLEYCCGKDIDIIILTNLTKIDTSFFQDISNHRISFQVSIDGTREIHDSRRGEGNFDKTMANAKSLFDLGYSLTSSMVLDFNNYKSIIDVMNIPFFSSFNCLPLAYTNEHNKALNDENPLTRKEYDSVISLLYHQNKTIQKSVQRCHMFPLGLGIRYDGNVYPCAVARDYDLFCMGNLNDFSLDEIIMSFESTPSGKIICSYIDNSNISECNNCKSNNICNRGCRIRAYKLFGKLEAPDLFCCRIFGEENSNICINNLFWGDRS